MKQILMGAAMVLVMAGCGNSGNTGSEAGDTTSPASGATGMGPDRQATDTTGLDVSAVQPVDTGNRQQVVTDDVPGADRSGVKYKIGADSVNTGKQ